MFTPGSRPCGYRTASGRAKWLTEDPIGERYEANLYRFVYNSPLNYVDPDGLTGWALNGPQVYWDANYRNTIQSPDYQQGFREGMGKAAVEGGSVLASIFIEPLDWAMTGKEIYDDPTNPWSYAGIVPFVPSAAGKFGKLCLDKLSDAGKQLDKGGLLTKAGRAAQKHGSRPGNAFPPTKGNPSAINQQGQDILDDILTSPNQTTKPNRFGGTDIYAPDGRGARYDANGNFMGFLEP